jgi:hypothetical protein
MHACPSVVFVGLFEPIPTLPLAEVTPIPTVPLLEVTPL